MDSSYDNNINIIINNNNTADRIKANIVIEPYVIIE